VFSVAFVLVSNVFYPIVNGVSGNLKRPIYYSPNAKNNNNGINNIKYANPVFVFLKQKRVTICCSFFYIFSDSLLLKLNKIRHLVFYLFRAGDYLIHYRALLVICI